MKFVFHIAYKILFGYIRHECFQDRHESMFQPILFKNYTFAFFYQFLIWRFFSLSCLMTYFTNSFPLCSFYFSQGKNYICGKCTKRTRRPSQDKNTKKNTFLLSIWQIRKCETLRYMDQEFLLGRNYAPLTLSQLYGSKALNSLPKTNKQVIIVIAQIAPNMGQRNCCTKKNILYSIQLFFRVYGKISLLFSHTSAGRVEMTKN